MAAREKRLGAREIRVAVKPDAKFEDLVRVLREALSVPEIAGLRGCRPCLSGLDRFVLEDFSLPRIR